MTPAILLTTWMSIRLLVAPPLGTNTPAKERGDGSASFPLSLPWSSQSSNGSNLNRGGVNRGLRDFAVLQVFVPLTQKWRKGERHAAPEAPEVGSKAWLVHQSTSGWRAYSARHGYTYSLVQQRMGDPDMPIHFVRFLAILELLLTHRWVYYVDIDVILQTPDVPLSQLTAKHRHCLIVATDMRGFYARFAEPGTSPGPCPRARPDDAQPKPCYSRLNAGVLLVQRADDTTRLGIRCTRGLAHLCGR